MSTFPSLPAPPASGLRKLAQIACCATVLAVVSLIAGVASAGAIVETIPATATVGLQPRATELFSGAGLEPESFANENGNPVLSANRTYLIYWDPTDHYHGDWQGLIDGFMHSMGAASGSLASVFAVDSQYTDAENEHATYASAFMGAYTDTTPYPTTGNCADPHPLEGNSYPKKEPDQIACLTNYQIEEELKLFIDAHKLPRGMDTIFYMLTPPGVTVCIGEGKATGHCSDYAGSPGETSYENSFCSYHGDINPDKLAAGDLNTILYAAIPWIAGGYGDGHLAPEDRRPGDECQDGGFDPSSKPIEEKEKIKEHTKKELEEFEKENAKEKREREEAEALELEKPHEQEPNQAPCPTADGYCDTGLADLIINQIAVEQQNIVTDPLLGSWQDPSGNEVTDECRDYFAPVLSGGVTANPETFAGTLYNQALAGGKYYLNDAFNLAALKLPYPNIPCLGGIRLEPKFTAPNPVKSGEIVDFDGMESYLTLNVGYAYTGTTAHKTYATYTWNFGDGSPEVSGFAPGAPSQNSPETSPCEEPWLAPCAASEFHSYQYGGVYDVTLTVKDVGSNSASVTEPITVEGPPRPPSSPAPSGASGPGASGPGSSGPGTSGPSSSSGPGTQGTTKPQAPAPVAAQAVVSTSLARTVRKGLVVKYSVNEQVAGSFDVLLAASTAKRIGLHMPLAVGLPAGTPPQEVVGKALLITTKGGRGTIKIQFGKVTRARIRRLGKVSLLLQLNVRNASGGTTTVLSKIILR